TRPPEGFVDYVNARPYYVRPSGQYAWGHARTVDILPLINMQPIVATDDTETPTTACIYRFIQERGLVPTSVTFGYRLGDVEERGLPPTRQQGDMSAVKGRALVAGEYEFERPKGTYPLDLWEEIIVEGGLEMPSNVTRFDPSAQPRFLIEGPSVFGSLIILNAVAGKSVKVERIDGGGTWEINRDGLPSSVDVAALDDDGNPGLSSALGQYEITLYSDFVANRNVDTLTATRIINVNLTGSPATNEIELMSAAPPAIGDTFGSVTIRCSSSTPDLTVERRYSVNGGEFTGWSTMSSASAPTTNTTFNITGLPTARAVTGQIDPPQYQVDVEVRATLHSGATVYDIEQRGFSYTTNAEDV